jgi:hypothetical protein
MSDVANVAEIPTRGHTPTTRLVERIAQETASLPNRRAWTEIIAKLRAEGRSASRARELRGTVWTARKRNSAERRQRRTLCNRDVGNVA